MIKFGANKIFRLQGDGNDEDIETIIARSRADQAKLMSDIKTAAEPATATAAAPSSAATPVKSSSSSSSSSGAAAIAEEDEDEAAVANSKLEISAVSAADAAGLDLTALSTPSKPAEVVVVDEVEEDQPLVGDAKEVDTPKRGLELEKSEQNSADTFDLGEEMLDVFEFGGTNFRKKGSAAKKRSSLELGQQWALELDGKKRERKATTVSVGGYEVLRANNYEMESDMGRPLEERDIGATFLPIKYRRFFSHEGFCHSCHDGGLLLLCDLCPRSYHLECLGLNREPRSFRCPQHSCKECQRNAIDAGGLLFRCIVCPVAYCEEHAPEEVEEAPDDRCPSLEALGYRPRSGCFWVICSQDCLKYHQEQKQLADAAAEAESKKRSPSKAKTAVWTSLHESVRNDLKSVLKPREKTSGKDKAEIVELDSIPGVHNALMRLNPRSPVVEALYEMLFGHEPRGRINGVKAVLAWRGLPPKATNDQIGKLYSAIVKELRMWNRPTLYTFCDLFGLCTRSPPTEITRGPRKGQMTIPEKRKFTPKDSASAIVHHIACFLMAPDEARRVLPTEKAGVPIPGIDVEGESADA